MPSKAIPRETLLCIDRILREYTDDETDPKHNPAHALGSGSIAAKLRDDFGITISAKTVSRCLEDLQAFYDRPTPSRHRGTALLAEGELGRTTSCDTPSAKRWYWMRSRLFEPSEVEYLATLAKNAPRVRNPEKLCEKLGCLLSVNQRRRLALAPRPEPLPNAIGAPIQTLLYNVNVLEEAIAKGRLVSFSYCKHDGSHGNSELTPERCVGYIPYCVECVEGYYYLVAKAKGRRKSSDGKRIRFRTLRVDRMQEVAPEKCGVSLRPNDYRTLQQEARAYIRAAVNRMPSERIETVRLKCYSGKSVAIVRESFGEREGFSQTTMEGSLPAEFTFRVSADGFSYWAMKFLEDIEVIEPASLRDRIIGMIENNRYGLFEKRASSKLKKEPA